MAALAGAVCARGCGGPGVGAIGMCFTGNFALSMMLEPSMLAPVLSQPSLPLDNPAGIEIAPDEVKAVRERLEREDLTVLAYRFEGDKFCMAQRFAAYSGALGDRFIGRVLPDSAANTDLAPFFERHVTTPHSVVTAHLIDEVGHPTIAARDEILAFFEHRLVRELGNHQPRSAAMSAPALENAAGGSPSARGAVRRRAVADRARAAPLSQLSELQRAGCLRPPVVRGHNPRSRARDRAQDRARAAERPARRAARESSRRGPLCASGALPGRAPVSLEAGMILPKSTFQQIERPAPREGRSRRFPRS